MLILKLQYSLILLRSNCLQFILELTDAMEISLILRVDNKLQLKFKTNKLDANLAINKALFCKILHTLPTYQIYNIMRVASFTCHIFDTGDFCSTPFSPLNIALRAVVRRQFCLSLNDRIIDFYGFMRFSSEYLISSHIIGTCKTTSTRQIFHSPNQLLFFSFDE